MQEQKFKAAEYRENQLGTEFISCPQENMNRVFVTGEIVSAEDFPEAELFITYRVSLAKGWFSEIPQDYNINELTEQQKKQLNCFESMTHSTTPIAEQNQNGGVLTKYYFCFPIDFQLIHGQKIDQWPTIHFEVYSRDFWDRIYMHGCGFTKIPSTPGLHMLEVETWKPTVDLQTRISEFYLGGLIKPKNIEEISKSQKLNEMEQPGPANRYMFNTISAGRVSLRLNVTIQSKKVKDDERVVFKAQKLSEQIEQKKKENTSNFPSFYNTGTMLASRFSNTKL